ncbi:cardiolipin synthase [Psychrobacter sp. FDAARGOS_221]|uniref:cardiolipin synthase n=1 Tax=Psychrobacter sp. FDAARGOS_221 TaxID=1975705 RepID=UPI000BB53F9E|nr:cardiolipin synthase [Psychrobacter sp. FDAARGOS_221]PNK59583.1 cardiolipin synthase [Psychrobacter sp. FDAARGOS_221]
MFFDLLFILHFGLWLLISLRVLSRHDLTSSARLAWLVVLFIVPYFGVVVYWMFGEVHLGLNFQYRHEKIKQRLQDSFPQVLGQQSTLQQVVAPEYQTALSYASSVTGFQTTLGNKAQLMADAKHTQQQMIADFDAATDHIHVLYYIWLEDGMGTDVANALIRAAQRGVTCRAMVDGLGSRKLIKSDLWQAMRQAGVEVSVALPIDNIIKVLLLSRLDLRNHRKITIIDGKIGYVGSRNSADPEFRVKPKYAPWVDIMLRVQGPVVAQNQMLFASDWLMQNPDTRLDSFPFITTQQPDGCAAQVFADGPSQRQGTTPQFLSTLMSQAKHSLTISTPYFVPDFTLLNMLCSVALRGVDVKIIFPKHNDSFIVAATSHSYYWQMLQAGIKIYEYRSGLLHAKTFTVDGQISLIGSTNLDLRSFDLNYENNMIFYDTTLTEKIRRRQQQYIDDSDEVSLHQVEAWPFYYRIWTNVVATMGPLL